MFALVLLLASTVSADQYAHLLHGNYAGAVQKRKDQYMNTKYHFVGDGCLEGDWKEMTDRMFPKIPEQRCAWECSNRIDCKMVSTKDGKCYYSNTLGIDRSWTCNEKVYYVIPDTLKRYPDSGVLCEGIPGDASGGSETLLASDVHSLKECSELVVKNDKTANAAIWGPSNKKCYKEVGATSIASSSAMLRASSMYYQMQTF